jgi:nucleotide-binding universal stress UspA family protein
MTTILIGVDDSPRSEDAVAFAVPLARAAEARMVLACAFPYDDMPSRASNLEYRAIMKAQAERTLAKAAAGLEDLDPARVKTIAVASVSPARALDQLAASEGAELIVVGSTHTGRLGRIVPGSTAERLMHGAPCPVAIVSHGLRAPAAGAPARIGVAYDGSPESDAALHAAAAIARALDGDLRVIGVLDAISYSAPALMGGPGYHQVRETIEDQARQALERTVAGLPADVRAEPVFAAGDVVREIAARTKGLDLLVAGSRGYGPTRSVLLGGVTGRLIRTAECPLIVVPRGVETPLSGLFGAAATVA